MIDTYIDYFQQGGESSGIEMTEKQKEVLERVRFADEKIRERTSSREMIARYIMGKFNVCRDTAKKDMVIAERVFSSSYPLNKNSLIEARIEFLEKQIRHCILDKDYVAAAMFERSLQKYIEMYKDIVPKRTPKTIIFNIQNNIHQTNVTVEQAVNEADTLANYLEHNDDY